MVIGAGKLSAFSARAERKGACMNVLFVAAICLSLVFLLFLSPGAAFPAILKGSERALALSSSLVASYAVFLGLTEILTAAKFHAKLAEFCSPLFRKLFRRQDKDTENAMTLCYFSNILGLGAVATPMGIETVKGMERAFLSSPDGTRTQARVEFERRSSLFFILTCTAMQLLPTNVIALRVSFGSAAPDDILLPALLCGLFCFCLGLLFCLPVNAYYRKVYAKKLSRGEKNIGASTAGGRSESKTGSPFSCSEGASKTVSPHGENAGKTLSADKTNAGNPFPRMAKNQEGATSPADFPKNKTTPQKRGSFGKEGVCKL